MKKEEILKELRTIANLNGGKLPKDSISRIADKVGNSYALVYMYAKEAGLIAKFTRYIATKTEKVTDRNRNIIYGPRHQDNPKDVIIHLSRLEGAVNGIKAFHPKLARYMQEQLDTIFRICYSLGMVERNLEETNFKELSNKSKPGYEEIDNEINLEFSNEKKNLNSIQDNIISNDLEDTNL